MKFFASAPAREYPPLGPTTLIIDAEAAHDAKQYAMRVLGSDGLLFQETGDEATTDIGLRWVGDDYGAGGTPNRRRLQIRKRVGKNWGGWEEIT